MKNEELFLVADIGGTNARFAVVNGKTGHWLGNWQAKVADYPTLMEAILALQERLPVSRAVKAVCLAVGAPIVDDHVRFTNSNWSFSKHTLKKQLNWPKVLVINDFGAAAYGVLAIPIERHHVVGEFKSDNFYRPSAVIGPGTGLGVAGLYPHQDSWLVSPTEAGHAKWAVSSTEEFELWKMLQNQKPCYAKSYNQLFDGYVQREDILSGPGIALLYQVLAKKQNKNVELLTTEHIVNLALSENNSLCTETLRLFCRLLGSALADIAFDLGVRGNIFLAGGVLPNIKQVFLESDFTQAFTRHPTFHFYLQSINILLVEEKQLGLIGAHNALLHHLGRPINIAEGFHAGNYHGKNLSPLLC